MYVQDHYVKHNQQVACNTNNVDLNRNTQLHTQGPNFIYFLILKTRGATILSGHDSIRFTIQASRFTIRLD